MTQKSITRSMLWMCVIAAIMLPLATTPILAHATNPQTNASQDNKIVLLSGDENDNTGNDNTGGDNTGGDSTGNGDATADGSATTDVYLKAESVEPTPAPTPSSEQTPTSDTSSNATSTSASSAQTSAMPNTSDSSQLFTVIAIALFAACGLLASARALKAGEK